jgi:hypothetical protein
LEGLFNLKEKTLEKKLKKERKAFSVVTQLSSQSLETFENVWKGGG